MINITSKYALDPGNKDSKLLEEEEEEEETKNYRKISKKIRKNRTNQRVVEASNEGRNVNKRGAQPRTRVE